MVSDTAQCLFQFVFALRIKASIESGYIQPHQINHILTIDDTETTFDGEECNNKENMLLLAENAVAMSIAALSIAADEELNRVLGAKNPARTDYPFNLRAVIYQIRNCFAHNLLVPTFKVKPAYQHSYTLGFLKGAPIVDFKQLNGTVFNYGNVGGFDNFYALFEESEKLIQQSRTT